MKNKSKIISISLVALALSSCTNNDENNYSLDYNEVSAYTWSLYIPSDVQSKIGDTTEASGECTISGITQGLEDGERTYLLGHQSSPGISSYPTSVILGSDYVIMATGQTAGDTDYYDAKDNLPFSSGSVNCTINGYNFYYTF